MVIQIGITLTASVTNSQQFEMFQIFLRLVQIIVSRWIKKKYISKTVVAIDDREHFSTSRVILVAMIWELLSAKNVIFGIS